MPYGPPYVKLAWNSSTNKVRFNVSTFKQIVYPETMDVSFSGISTACIGVCQDVSIGLVQSVKINSLGTLDANDTFTLVRAGDSGTTNPCKWLSGGLGFGSVTAYYGTGCFPKIDDGVISFGIQLIRQPAGWLLQFYGIATIPSAAIQFSVFVFSGNALDADATVNGCGCGPLNFSNDLVSSGSAGQCCNAPPCIGTGGTAVVTM